jgi:hypothetical protein
VNRHRTATCLSDEMIVSVGVVNGLQVRISCIKQSDHQNENLLSSASHSSIHEPLICTDQRLHHHRIVSPPMAILVRRLAAAL